MNERNDKCNDIRILYTCIILEFNDEINVNSLFIYIYNIRVSADDIWELKLWEFQLLSLWNFGTRNIMIEISVNSLLIYAIRVSADDISELKLWECLWNFGMRNIMIDIR